MYCHADRADAPPQLAHDTLPAPLPAAPYTQFLLPGVPCRAVPQVGTSDTYPNLRLDVKRLLAEEIFTFAAFCAKYIRQA